MRKHMLVICLLTLGTFFTQAQDRGAVTKEALKLLSDMTDVLKSVKDKASAEAALPKLRSIDKRIAILMEAKYEPSADEEKQWAASGGAEIDRIEKLPEVRALFTKEWTFFKTLTESKIDLARTRLVTIGQAIEIYELKTTQWPKSLNALTEGDMPIMKRAGLIDPWNNTYQYDAAGPKNKGKRPDVWTLTPDKKVIGNWEEKKR